MDKWHEDLGIWVSVHRSIVRVALVTLNLGDVSCWPIPTIKSANFWSLFQLFQPNPSAQFISDVSFFLHWNNKFQGSNFLASPGAASNMSHSDAIRRFHILKLVNQNPASRTQNPMSYHHLTSVSLWHWPLMVAASFSHPKWTQTLQHLPSGNVT